MAIKKKYIGKGGFCKVTFTLSANLADEALSANVVGEFNNWDTRIHRMKKLKNGEFTLSIELQSNNEYQFRYLIDGIRWETDWESDSQTLIPWADEYNSVVKV
jgi:1,4-alpha-glucan branching enzyme